MSKDRATKGWSIYHNNIGKPIGSFNQEDALFYMLGEAYAKIYELNGLDPVLNNLYRDAYLNVIQEGDTLSSSFGIPPRKITGKVYLNNGRYMVKTDLNDNDNISLEMFIL